MKKQPKISAGIVAAVVATRLEGRDVKPTVESVAEKQEDCVLVKVLRSNWWQRFTVQRKGDGAYYSETEIKFPTLEILFPFERQAPYKLDEMAEEMRQALRSISARYADQAEKLIVSEMAQSVYADLIRQGEDPDHASTGPPGPD